MAADIPQKIYSQTLDVLGITFLSLQNYIFWEERLSLNQ